MNSLPKHRPKRRTVPRKSPRSTRIPVVREDAPAAFIENTFSHRASGGNTERAADKTPGGFHAKCLRRTRAAILTAASKQCYLPLPRSRSAPRHANTWTLNATKVHETLIIFFSEFSHFF